MIARALRLTGQRWGCFLLGGACLLFAFNASPLDRNPSTEVRVAAVGDIMLGGTATLELPHLGYDYPFEHVRALLQAADIGFGNLEGPLTERGEPFQGKQYLFRSPPGKVAPALARAGIRLVSLANNHVMDYGVDGLRDTMAALEAAGIHYAGAGEHLAAARRPARLEIHGQKIALLAYTLTFPEEFWAAADRPGTAFGHEQQVRADVAAARKNADIVLVSFHWGREGTDEPRDYQRLLGHAAIDAGAAAVVGHHPHILQGVEQYGGGIICYSLANFVFGSYSEQATRSVVALLQFREGRVQAVEFHPINVKNVEVVFQPRRLSGSDADEVVNTLQRLSQSLGTRLENRNGVAVWSRAARS